MNNTFDAPTSCPWCGRTNPAAAAMDGTRAPKDHDWSVCYGCGRLGVFEIDAYGTRMRKPTREEEIEADGNEYLQSALASWRDHVLGKPRPLRAGPLEMVSIVRRRIPPEKKEPT